MSTQITDSTKLLTANITSSTNFIKSSKFDGKIVKKI